MLDYKQFHIYQMLARQAPTGLTRLVLKALFCGMLQAIALLSIVQGLTALTQRTLPVRPFLIFMVSIIAFYLISRHVVTTVTSMTLDGLLTFRLRIAAKLRATGLAAHDALPMTRVRSALLDPQTMVVEGARLTVVMLYSTTMIGLAMLQAFHISPEGAIYILVVLSACIMTLLILHKAMLQEMHTSTVDDHAFCASLDDLFGGYEELKSNRGKTGSLFQDQIRARHRIAHDSRKRMEGRYATGMAFFGALALLAVGIILFTLPIVVPGLAPEMIAPLVMLAMAIVMPMTGFVAFIPTFAKSEAALGELTTVERLLDEAAEAFEQADTDANWPTRHAVPVEFETLSMRNMQFEYPPVENGRGFTVRIASFVLARGEMVFLRGGNGSGKTTFMTMLAGLYTCSAGEMKLNGRPLDDIGPEAYRNMFSLITADPYLFPCLLDKQAGDVERGNALLKQVHLGKVSIDEDGSFSTTSLSAGQRKRLALVSALLEDRSILLFDELAADFDPEYREHFYREFLPALKEQGKTVVVISHDDRYFDVADRLLLMRDGQFVADE